MRCRWCEQPGAYSVQKNSFWELPSGLRAIEIRDIPAVFCPSCEMHDIKETTIEEIEDQLLLVIEDQLASQMTFEQMMAVPRRLKQNYFKQGRSEGV
ncbi:YokU family protein [Halalkalibacterium ligniniphilum]|uniref:YokU family protein n=1 Tax=Halalkalibacterium ligniniphilum TaxID=1134413 RepID=UPI000348D953|nr:YokU family protein [Halalkalibacterium ligniniphilum]